MAALYPHIDITPDGRSMFYGSTVPNSAGDGNFGIGDTIYNTIPSASTPFAWVCTAAGTGASASFLSVGAPTALGGTLTSGSTIAVTSSAHHVTGTAAIATITPPAGWTNGRSVKLIADGIYTWTAGGNIAVAGTSTAVGRFIEFTWDSGTSKWYPSAVS